MQWEYLVVTPPKWELVTFVTSGEHVFKRVVHKSTQLMETTLPISDYLNG